LTLRACVVYNNI